MSIKLMSAAWELEIPSTEKMVLMCLCDYANDVGEHCWPSISTIARKCSKSERTIQAAIRSLEKMDFLTALERKGTSNSFFLHPRRIMEKPKPDYHHYVYRIDDLTAGYFYIGARSSVHSPDDDDYMGSGNWVKEARRSGHALSKTVLEIVGDRTELAQAELRLVQPHFGHPDCKNEKLPTPGTLSPLHTPAKSAPRKICTPQKTSKTPAKSAPPPAKSAPNPSLNLKEPPKVKSSDDDAFTISDFVESWNEAADECGLSKIRKLTTARQRAFKVRKREYPEIDDWKSAFRCLRTSKWMHGDNPRGWRADPDFFLSSSKFTKLVEGSYGKAD